MPEPIRQVGDHRPQDEIAHAPTVAAALREVANSARSSPDEHGYFSIQRFINSLHERADSLSRATDGADNLVGGTALCVHRVIEKACPTCSPPSVPPTPATGEKLEARDTQWCTGCGGNPNLSNPECIVHPKPSTVALAPCPFCGDEANKAAEPNGRVFSVWCKSCGGGVNRATSSDCAADAWNARRPLPPPASGVAGLADTLDDWAGDLEDTGKAHTLREAALMLRGLSRPASVDWNYEDRLEAIATFGGRVVYYNGNHKVMLGEEPWTNCELAAFKTDEEARAWLQEAIAKSGYTRAENPVFASRPVGYEFTKQWYAERLVRLRQLAEDNGLLTEHCSIVANGTASAMEPPTYAQQLNLAKHAAEAATQRAEDLQARLTKAPTDEMVEIACRHFAPLIFSDDPVEAHKAANPIKLEVARKITRDKVRAGLTEALASLPPTGEG